MKPISDQYIAASISYGARVAICQDGEGQPWFCVERTREGEKVWEPERPATQSMIAAMEIHSGVRDTDGNYRVGKKEANNS